MEDRETQDYVYCTRQPSFFLFFSRHKQCRRKCKHKKKKSMSILVPGSHILTWLSVHSTTMEVRPCVVIIIRLALSIHHHLLLHLASFLSTVPHVQERQTENQHRRQNVCPCCLLAKPIVGKVDCARANSKFVTGAGRVVGTTHLCGHFASKLVVVVGKAGGNMPTLTHARGHTVSTFGHEGLASAREVSLDIVVHETWHRFG